MPEVLVFNVLERRDAGRKWRAESVFDYLNRSGETAAGMVRDLIEGWYTQFPDDGKNDIRGRLRSGEATGFDSAFHELCLHDLVIRLGCTAKLHPILAVSTKNPDFLVQGDEPGEFILEAVAPTDVSEPKARQRAATLLDGLDSKLQSPDYWLSVTVEQYGKQNGSPKSFARFVGESLANLQARPRSEAPRGDIEPQRFEYREYDWVIAFEAMPKADAIRGTSGLGAIAMELSRFHEITVHRSLRVVLEKKAKRYGHLDLPYIIAVNTNDMFGDEHELLMALFGFGATPARGGRKSSALPNDGLWVKLGTPRNTQVSGILFTRKISAAKLGSAAATLYLNPWAARPYTGGLTQMPTAIFEVDGSEFDVRPGRGLRELLHITGGWPGWTAEPAEEDNAAKNTTNSGVDSR